MENTMEYYESLLKIAPTYEMKITSLTDYINAISAINKFYKKVFFRGQADSTWGIESSAYRALKSPTQKLLQDYHLNIISEINNLQDTSNYSGITLLAHLQHNGAKTCLIDYTLNPLISLWFACITEEEKDGNVYAIENSNLINGLILVDGGKEVKDLFMESNKTYVFYPPNINRRIISQQSVFLISTTGIIDKSKHMSITIPSKYKKEILKQLSLVGICRKTLFPDFNGFIEWYSFESEPGREQYDETVRKAEKYLIKFKFNDAIDLFNDAIVLGKNLFGSDSLELASTYNNIGGVYHKQGDYITALEWYQKALAITEKVLGKEHPDTAGIYNDIAGVYCQQSDYEKALEWNQKALAIREKVLGKECHDTAQTYNNIAGVYHKQEDYITALEWYQKALAITEKVLGKEHPHTAGIYNNIGAVYAKQENYEKALEWYQKALAITEKVLGKEHPDTAHTYNNIGLVYYRQSDHEKALKYYIQAYKILYSVHGEEHPVSKAVKENVKKIGYDSYCKEDNFEQWLKSQLNK